MRGGDERPGALLSYVDLEARVDEDRPLRTIRSVVNGAFGRVLGALRQDGPPLERLKLDLLFRCFVGIGVDDVVWDHSTFSKNRDRLMDGDIAAKFLSAVLARPASASVGPSPSQPPPTI